MLSMLTPLQLKDSAQCAMHCVLTKGQVSHIQSQNSSTVPGVLCRITLACCFGAGCGSSCCQGAAGSGRLWLTPTAGPAAAQSCREGCCSSSRTSCISSRDGRCAGWASVSLMSSGRPARVLAPTSGVKAGACTKGGQCRYGLPSEHSCCVCGRESIRGLARNTLLSHHRQMHKEGLVSSLPKAMCLQKACQATFVYAGQLCKQILYLTGSKEVCV